MQPCSAAGMAAAGPRSAAAKPRWHGITRHQLAAAAPPPTPLGYSSTTMCSSSSAAHCAPDKLDLLVVFEQRDQLGSCECAGIAGVAGTYHAAAVSCKQRLCAAGVLPSSRTNSSSSST